MKKNILYLIVYSSSLISYHYCSSQQVYSIPKQTINPFKILGPKQTIGSDAPFGTPPKFMKLNMSDIIISNMITFGQYREYLKAMKKDSSNKFYLSQLPDTSICTKETYKEYVAGNKYDDYPVMGISWDAAMNYCRWKTIQNNKGIIQYIYRLPCESEWLSAYLYLNTASVKNDFNKNYSDWLLNSFDEDAVEFIDTKKTNHWNNFDFIHLSVKKEPNVVKRKCVIGDSYLYKLETLADYSEISFNSYDGYRQVGFRYIKEVVDTVKQIDKNGSKQPSIDNQILNNWGLK